MISLWYDSNLGFNQNLTHWRWQDNNMFITGRYCVDSPCCATCHSVQKISPQVYAWTVPQKVEFAVQISNFQVLLGSTPLCMDVIEVRTKLI
jgi:hypothetical protein